MGDYYLEFEFVSSGDEGSRAGGMFVQRPAVSVPAGTEVSLQSINRGCRAPIWALSRRYVFLASLTNFASKRKLELVLIQPHMRHKPVLWGEVDARALRV